MFMTMIPNGIDRGARFAAPTGGVRVLRDRSASFDATGAGFGTTLLGSASLGLPPW